MKRRYICAIMMAAAVALAGCGNSSSEEVKSSAAETSSTVESSKTEGESESSAGVSEESEASSGAVESEAVQGTEETQEPSASTETEDPYADITSKAEESYALISQYGNDGEYSLLSYDLKGSTLQDCGDYYAIDAVFSKPVTVPGNLEIGDEYTFVADELTQETITVEYTSEGILTDHASGQEYYYRSEGGEGDVVLYCGSDDRVDAPFYEGTLRIRKDATTGIAIAGEYEQISAEILSQDDWYNGVAFDGEGFITDLIHIGD